MVSIIIRTKNEERWITQCLNAVFSQDFKDFEVIIVDNESTDNTLEKAKQFDIKKVIVYEGDQYLPGKALNMGIQEAKGDRIVCLSGHCIPTDNRWLRNLLGVFSDSDTKIAGVYGRQAPMSFTPDSDKRDLAIAFGFDAKIQKNDPFFHNANSMIRKDIWKNMPFDETATNIEDRIWAKEVLGKGYKIAYEPEAAVYHYHGIHQGGDEERCRNVVRIMEDLHADHWNKPVELDKMNIVAIIPVKGEVKELAGKPLISYTIKRALESKYIKNVIVSTDNPEVAKIANKLGAQTPFIRDKSFSEEHVDLDRVFQYSLKKIEEIGIFPDLVATLEVTFPFRTKGLIDKVIAELAFNGLDSIVAAKRENRAIWKEKDSTVIQLNEGITPRKFKDPTDVELRGVATVTHPEFIRKGHILGDKLGIYEIKNPYSHLEVRSKEDFELASSLIKGWFK
ncbi:glycosyltransferase family 2 protein [Candidatus Omnitrophota bacterium]